jgi:hypothetical protein
MHNKPCDMNKKFVVVPEEKALARQKNGWNRWLRRPSLS